MKKHSAFAVTAISALSIFLTGCSAAVLASDTPVTLTMWHVYGSQTESPLSDAVNEFNNTVGKEQGIVINVTSTTDSGKIDEMLTDSLEEKPGAISLPDLFTAYPRVAEKFHEDQLLDWTPYFTEEELSKYRAEFLSEGYFGDQLLMLPIAKSSELLFVNKTLFDRFAAENGLTDGSFSSIENLMSACSLYYDWSDGNTLFQINDFYHYFLANMTALGSEFIVDGKICTDDANFEKVWEPIAEAGIYGGLCVGDGYASDRWKTGEVLCNIGSTAGILYLRDYVTYTDNTTEEIETAVLPYPCLEDAAPTVVHRGGGLFALKSSNEEKNEAAAVFAKWIAQKQHNLDFVTKSGYLPVTDEAFDALFSNLDSVENDKYRMLFDAVKDQYQENYQFCAVPLFENASDTQKAFESLIKTTLSKAHDEYLQRVEKGEDKDKVMDELKRSAFEYVRDYLKS